jgi:acetate kinase
MRTLVLNGGSSSFKCWFHTLSDDALSGDAPEPTWQARIEWNQRSGLAKIRFQVKGTTTEREIPVQAPVDALPPVLEALWTGETKVISRAREIDIVGHRIVHGGIAHRNSELLTPKVRDAISKQVEFAPAHNRFELEAIATVDQVVGPAVRQVAVFDTGFHATLPPAAYVYPGPYGWLQEGVRRFGFHGISHQYASRRAAQLLGRDPASMRVITCHLGSGASLAAIRDGKSVDTTMGFTPLEGLMMGTRSGSVDPGIIIYLLRHAGYSADQLDDILNKHSGLRGVSGISDDMRDIQEAIAAGNERAKLAFDMYAHRLCREIGGMLVTLGGLDVLVFTGGIGENSGPIREAACNQLAFLGLKLDTAKNAGSPVDENIAVPESAIPVLVIHAEEDWEIARECYRLAGKE